MKYKAIIFDMDGTIIATGGVWEQATEVLISAKGKNLTEEQRKLIIKQTHGLHIKPSCTLIKNILNLEENVEELATQLAILANRAYANVQFIEGFPEFHAQAHQHNLKTGLATNAIDSTIEITKRVLKLEQFFGEHIYNITHVNNKYKPDPAVYLHAAKQLGISPSHCIAIEDSAHGVTAAKNAGMFCIGINTAGRKEQLNHADLIVDGYHQIDLKDLLKLGR